MFCCLATSLNFAFFLKMVFHCPTFGQTLFARLSHRTFCGTNTMLDEMFGRLAVASDWIVA